MTRLGMGRNGRRISGVTHYVAACASVVHRINGSQEQLLLGVGNRDKVFFRLVCLNGWIFRNNCFWSEVDALYKLK